MTYYVVNTGRIRLGGAVTSRGTHIMWSKTPSTPDPGSLGGIAAQLTWFGGNAKTTLCGLPALRNVSDVFTPAEVSCRECRKRWQAAMAKEQAGARQEAEQRQRQAERRQRYRVLPGLDRSAEDVADAGASLRAAVRYESGSDRWRRRYLSRRPAVARQLFPDGVPAEQEVRERPSATAQFGPPQQARTETPEERTARLRAQVWKLYDQGMRVERISATLGIPVDTVERHLGKP